MTWIAVSNAYISGNILLGLAALTLVSLRSLSKKLRTPVMYRHQLVLGYGLSASALILPLAAQAVGPSEFLPPTAQVWSAPTMKAWSVPAQAAHQTSLMLTHASTPLPLNFTSALAVAVFSLGCVILFGKVARDVLALRRILGQGQVVRRIRGLLILVSEEVDVPFSYWLPGRYFIVVPSALIARRADLVIAIQHEAQHHRQHDTKWLYLYQILKALFFWNPAAHLLEKTMKDLQEFACDEALAGHRRISARAYCHCLLWVAETALRNHCLLVGTAGMTSGSAKNTLKRRIEVMLARPKSYLSRYTVLAGGVASFMLLAVTAFASTSVVHDRRVTMDDAKRMAEVARDDSDFPIVVNDLVLEQLNRFLGTPDGRAYIKGSLARMESYRELITKDLAEYRLPTELLAVPLIESGYRNRPESDNPMGAAGLWQFMAGTARSFGMRVDDQIDDRLNIGIATDGAMRLLASLNLQFKDWGLALLAYNAGSAMVEKAIGDTGSRDVWEIIRKGHENDPRYVAEVMAAVLILKNPTMLD